MKSLVVVKLIIALTGGTPHIESFSILQEESGSEIKVETKAEIDASSFVKSLETALTNSVNGSTASGEPELPAWLTATEDRAESDGDHSFLVITIPQPDVAACEEELKEKLPAEVHAFIDTNILRHIEANTVPFLTNDYIKKEILSLNPDRTFTKTLARPGGEMFQIYRQLTIPSSEVKRLVEYERSVVAGERSVKVGVGAASVIGVVGGLSALLGLMARREKSKGLA
ncbi:MAG: hypothetical protein MUC43_04400 [Pirellula sp.]|jgi:hypothetical protein|nr:hypothetical protein [Pirellula sp.]